MESTKPAPSFSTYTSGTRTSKRPGAYPLGGAKTGPAWRAMWRALQDLGPEEFISDVDLRTLGAAAGECAVPTAKLLLIRAANAGILERRHDKVRGKRGTRTQVSYRIAEQHR